MVGQISMFSVIRKDFDIKEYIPVGSENAVTRKYLSKVTGLSDRRVRHAIHEARRDIPILNLSDGRVSHAGQQAELTRNELRILGLLMENAGKMVDRSTIMMRLWESDDYIDDNTLTVNVARIRRKLEEIGVHDYIVTKKGIGYMV